MSSLSCNFKLFSNKNRGVLTMKNFFSALLLVINLPEGVDMYCEMNAITGGGRR